MQLGTEVRLLEWLVGWQDYKFQLLHYPLQCIQFFNILSMLDSLDKQLGIKYHH